MRSVKGFSLIELLVSIAIAAIISLLIFFSYQALIVGGMRADALVTTQNDARNALSLMASDVQSAGFMLTGPAGIGRCTTLLTYDSGVTSSSNQISPFYPVLDTPQVQGAVIPNTNISLNYSSSSTKPIDAITLTYNNSASGGTSNQGLSSRVVKVTNGTDNNASLFVTNTSIFSQNDIDVVVLPTLNTCIRLQITNIGGANNIIHNSGLSPLNPPNGFSTFNSSLPRNITSYDLTQAFVADMGNPSTSSGPVQVTYSIRPLAGVPTLYRTLVGSNDQVLQDSGIASNVVDLRALYAPLNSDGTLGSFVDWSKIQSANQQNSVGAVEFAILIQRKNVGQRTNTPTSIQVLDTSYTTNPAYEYTLFSRTIYLNNVAWSQP